MKNLLLLAVAVVFPMVTEGARLNLMDVKTTSSGAAFMTELKFDQPVSTELVTTEFINETIQINIPDGYIAQGKRTTQVKDDRVKSVFTYQASKDLLRTRVILKSNLAADQYQETIKVTAEGDVLRIKVGAYPAKNEASLLDSNPVIPQGLKREIMEEMGITPSGEVSREAIAKASASSAVALAPSKTETTKIKPMEEEKIPVLAQSKTKTSSSALPIKKIIFGLIAFVGMALIFSVVLKGWTKISKKSLKHSQIKVITQHYLAPRKSLAIIRVAGESILIGITDQNITPIKTLSLLEDELPEEVPTNFERTLRQAEHEEIRALPESKPDKISIGATGRVALKAYDKARDVPEEFSVKGIKELVRAKLKGMNTI
ncbi:MAG: flagellar biosynthetic protein FliO [Pseudomonadota bacterium]|nr:flagellar biosynthetic protein FliO [Pseudomonadota bacterium]